MMLLPISILWQPPEMHVLALARYYRHEHCYGIEMDFACTH